MGKVTQGADTDKAGSELGSVSKCHGEGNKVGGEPVPAGMAIQGKAWGWAQAGLQHGRLCLGMEGTGQVRYKA